MHCIRRSYRPNALVDTRHLDGYKRFSSCGLGRKVFKWLSPTILSRIRLASGRLEAGKSQSENRKLRHLWHTSPLFGRNFYITTTAAQLCHVIGSTNTTYYIKQARICTFALQKFRTGHQCWKLPTAKLWCIYIHKGKAHSPWKTSLLYQDLAIKQKQQQLHFILQIKTRLIMCCREKQQRSYPAQQSSSPPRRGCRSSRVAPLLREAIDTTHSAEPIHQPQSACFKNYRRSRRPTMAGLLAVSIGLGAEKLGRTISEKRLERKEKKAIAVYYVS